MTKTIYDPETNYSKGTPFTYLIGWTELDIFYYGVRYKKNCHTDDLWTKYFTSSKVVKKFRQENGEPDLVKVDFVFDTAKEAIAYEYQFLKDNNCVHDPKWINLGNGGEDFCHIKSSAESIKKRADDNRGRIQINNGVKEKKIKPENLQEYLDLGWKIGCSEETRKKIGDANRGKKHSEETKQKTSEFIKGLIWINNSINEKRIKPEEKKSYLANGWKGGRLPKSAEAIKNNAKSQKGRIVINNGVKEKKVKPENLQEYLDLGWKIGCSEETIKKISDAVKGSIYINDGVKQKQIKPEFLQEFLNNDWVIGGLPHSKESIQKSVENKRLKRLAKLQSIENCF